MRHENYEEVVHQIEQIGCALRDRDKPLRIDEGRKTCGKGGKYWYRLHTYSPRGSTRSLVVGSFGSYKDGKAFKVEWDKEGLSAEQLEQYRREQEQARERERAKRDEEARLAALSAADLWRTASKEGRSAYLERKGVEPEACRYLPDGSILIPLVHYGMRELRAIQRIYPGPRFDSRTKEELPQKTFTKGFSKNGCSLRLGDVDDWTELLLACEGYATGLSIRMATARQVPVFVCLDAYNLGMVVPLLRELYPQAFILLCADDDWKTKDYDGPNPGRTKARRLAKATERCDFIWPVFDASMRQDKDTDFNDLHLREGLDVVARQLRIAMSAIEREAHGA